MASKVRECEAWRVARGAWCVVCGVWSGVWATTRLTRFDFLHRHHQVEELEGKVTAAEQAAEETIESTKQQAADAEAAAALESQQALADAVGKGLVEEFTKI